MNDPSERISDYIWRAKYRLPESDFTLEDTWRRVARTLASVEADNRWHWEERFVSLLRDFRFLPGGRIQAGAGTSRNVTLFNCFVMGVVEDSIPGIFRALREAAITMQQGGGIGIDFSTLRPHGTQAKAGGTIASGPVSFMEVWDAMCGTILSTGARRGAMMATLRCDHPDIEEFVTAKQTSGRLRRFNLSVQVTDAFMAAVKADEDWPLVFPAEAVNGHGETVLREWPGAPKPLECCILRSIRARKLWKLILRGCYDYAEPGVLFVDRINRLNNLSYCERITATNPCGEVPLPPYGACDLGSVNLTRFVLSPFTANARVDTTSLIESVRDAVRLLDSVIDVSQFPLPQQRARAQGNRRIGLGITGLADALLMLGLNYGDERARNAAAELMRIICHSAYRTSVALAKEKSPFRLFQSSKYLQSPFIQTLPDDIRQAIAKDGIRNSHLIAIAPTGTISLFAGNISSGIEPIFAASYIRKVLGRDGQANEFQLTDYALSSWRTLVGSASDFPPGFITAAELTVDAHLDMQATLQPYVDNSISKTINVPQHLPFDEFSRIYDLAYAKGLKGCTTFRPNPITGTVLSETGEGTDAPHCCVLEREAD